MSSDILSFRVFDDVLEHKNYLGLLEEFTEFYNFFVSNKSEHFNDAVSSQYYPIWSALFKAHPSKGLGDNLALINVAEILKLKAQKYVKKRLVLTRIQTNSQFFGQEATFHRDGGDDEWTFLVFVCPFWNTEWGGEFVIQTNSETYEYVSYMPNKGVLFRADFFHKGTAPNRLSMFRRCSVAATFSEM